MSPFLLVVAALSASSAAAHEASPPREGRFDNGPGPVSQWFRIAGEPSATPIIFLHGGPGQGSQTFQASVGPAIEQFATVVYYDQRGSGRSQRPSDPDLYSIPILLLDIDVLRNHLGADRVILLGHSFGSILALEYAATHPDRVAGLILTGAVPDMPATMKALCDRLRREDPPAHARTVAAAGGEGCQPFAAYDDARRKEWIEEAMFPDPATARQVEEWDNAQGLGNTGEMGNALFGKGLLEYRFNRPDRLTMPVLFIDGALDHQTTEDPQRQLAAQVANGAFLSYPRAGHFPFVDEPARFARDVRLFMEQIGAGDE
ncbi:alpha/beta fold hydrolase [Erythrobacter tepidarius]|uniref:alpha/beta fold hydrolase n=1 Tax=Erythrobacter tepidarius TaxID=60454 RepID=UPI001302487C|nr:alpha/beta fold hydrolase [Erythrobacter tepidarius]